MNKEYLIYKLSDEVKNSCKIDKEAFTKFNVKRGLRNEDGSGVLVGLTNIGNVVGYERDEQGKLKPTEGKLYYRGYELDDLVTHLIRVAKYYQLLELFAVDLYKYEQIPYQIKILLTYVFQRNFLAAKQNRPLHLGNVLLNSILFFHV